MRRLRRLALCAALVTTAWSDSGAAAGNLIGGVVRTALQKEAAVRGQAAGIHAARPGLRLPAGGALAFAQPLVRGEVGPADSGKLELRRSGVPLIAERGAVPVGGSGPREETRLTYPVSSRVSLGVGYSYITSEDLAFEVAETGSLGPDYDSHHVLLRAQWQF